MKKYSRGVPVHTEFCEKRKKEELQWPPFWNASSC